MILQQLTGLPFGHVTLAVFTLLIAGGLLSVAYHIILVLIKYILAFDDENAPEFKLKNVVWGRCVKMFDFIYKPDIVFACNKFILRFGFDSSLGYCRGGEDYHFFSNSDVGHPTKQEALDAFHTHGKGGIVNFKLIGMILGLDLVVFLLQLYFLQTIILLSLFGIVFSIRLIAKMLYKNINKTEKHESRIIKLEGGRND